MSAPPRGPEAACGVPGNREAKDLADASPLLPLPAPPSSSSPRRAFLHSLLHLLVAQTVGERITVLSSYGARPSSRGHLSSLGCSPSCPKHRRASAPALVMPAFEPGWESISCRCCCRPRRARNPLADISLAIPGSSLGRRVAAVVPSRRRGLDVRVHRTFLGTHPCTHAPTHAHAHAHAYARHGKVAPFSSLPSEPSSPAFRSLWTEESPPGKAFHPGSANARSLSSLCVWSRASQHETPPAVETTAAPASSHLSAVAHRAPTRICTLSHPCLQLQSRTRPRVRPGVRTPPASARPSPGQRHRAILSPRRPRLQPGRAYLPLQGRAFSCLNEP
jgi:hypothetical protein